MSQHIVCLGSSAASLSCTAQLKRLDPATRITIITKQAELPYNTCLLADYLAGQRTQESLFLPIPDGVDIHYSSTVTGIDAEAKKVITQHGSSYQYDKLFIGTGVCPRIPDWCAQELYTRFFPLATLADLTVFERFEKNMGIHHVAIMGGGATGIEAAWALTVRGYTVTLYEKQSSLLFSHKNPAMSQELYTLLERNGVRVVFGADDSAIMQSNAEAIFLALGTYPVAQHFLPAELATEGGFIVVDSQQRTSINDIFAGGDCVQGRSLWPQAVRDGVVAAYGILNYPVPALRVIQYKTIITVFGKIFLS